MNIFLVPNTTKPNTFAIACQVTDLLLADGHSVFAADNMRLSLKACRGIRFTPQEQGYAACDLVLTIGGDGTLLHTARHTMRLGKPLLGVNTGHLGFLTALEQGELDKLHCLSKGEYIVDERSVLQVRSGSFSSLALNDVVLFKQSPERTIALDILCDDILVSSFRGDGVVFATPTGSTAYSLAAGGPILDAQLNAIIVTQICAHILQTPPTVFSASRTLRAVPGDEVLLSCDGLQSIKIAAGEAIQIIQADICVPLVQFAEADQLKSIDKKLKGR